MRRCQTRQAVDGATRTGYATGSGADVDQVCDISRRVTGCLTQMRERRLRDIERALDVQLDHSIPLFRRAIQRRTEQHDSGVADERVEPAKLGDGSLHGSVGLHPSETFLLAGRDTPFGSNPRLKLHPSRHCVFPSRIPCHKLRFASA